jgi:ankyrin repeat protein
VNDARGARDVVRVLLEHGADAMLCDPQGRTALHLAIEQGHGSCVEALLDHTVATTGINGIHSDRLAVEIACLAAVDCIESQYVLMALLTSGACPHLVDDELLRDDLNNRRRPRFRLVRPTPCTLPLQGRGISVVAPHGGPILSSV